MYPRVLLAVDPLLVAVPVQGDEDAVVAPE
jgi:hypothetical protein